MQLIDDSINRLLVDNLRESLTRDFRGGGWI
jgi:hypothetical protein